MNLAVSHTQITKYSGAHSSDEADLLATEEPLEIRLVHGDSENRLESSIAVTMRTPGHDEELACGFLKTEGIITSWSDVVSVKYCEQVKEDEQDNVIKVTLRPGRQVNMKALNRHFYTTSSCGVCGKSSLDAVMQQCEPLTDQFTISSRLIYRLPNALQHYQAVFNHTGGLHATGLFDQHGELTLVREDIGRHNAMDKVIGHALMHDVVMSDKLMLVSGRVGFELVQKAVSARVPVLIAVGAPSSLAVSLAREADLVLIGFLRNQRFNIYSGENRVK